MKTSPLPLRVFPPGGTHRRPGGADSAVFAGLAHSASAKPVPWHMPGKGLFTLGIGLRATIPIVAFCLTACNASNQGNEWFPLREGEAQTYQASYDTDEPHETDIWTLTTGGPETVDGQAFMQRRHSDGVTYYFKVDGQGIRRVATRMDLDQEPTLDPEPRWVLKAPYAVGTEWTTPTVPYLIQRLNEHPRELKYTHTAQMTWRIEAVDDVVQLANGGPTLKPCLRLRGEAKLNLYTDPVNGFTDVPLISREWYCQDRGLVKFERTEKVPPGFLTGGVVAALVEP